MVTINLPDVALSSGGNYEEFWKLFEERTELCHKTLKIRYERVASVTSDVAPILWQYGAFMRLPKGENLRKYLHGGYASISLGFAGLYECVKYMTGESHMKGGKNFALEIMRKLNEKVDQWKKEENLGYSLYSSPIESTTYKFAKCLKNRFGVIPEITEYDYITNSYHYCVREQVDIFTKFKDESEFQALSLGGAISYGEVPNMQDNIPAVLQILQYIYDNIMYAELNTKSDYCQVCGFDGEIKIIEDENGKLDWECPQCRNRDHNKMSVSRRTCGYLGSNFWNQGRTMEIRDRVIHIDN